MTTADPDSLAIDRTDWPAGPWDQEVDRYDFRTTAGLPGMILRGHLGNLCGYVGVERGHPCYGKSYHEEPVASIQTHGGINYAKLCDGHICHVPEPGESDDVYWLGFHCARAFDLIPQVASLAKKHGLGLDIARFVDDRYRDVYRDVAYVRACCEDVALQLVAIAAEP